ncbi:MAG: S9 family peptidase, partial [Anaerolineales bacterium]|nr:S9 family peptidase [Anaerolineales bacterium]
DYNMSTRKLTLKKCKPVLGGFDPNNYQSERLMAPARDGTLVPISLVYRKGFVRDGDAPCLLYGYGSYGASMDPYFLINAISLLDRGFVYAIAHIRGGEEMGRAWYENGKFLHKKNTFTDFIDCGRSLIAENYTASEHMAITGRSAGGLLIGAVVNLAPDLAKVAFAGVPFVDVVTTMLDASIPLTAGEFEEWGNPQNEDFYWYMLSYSPYDNVEAKAYPHMLVTAGLNDPRVPYWEPTKWVAKLRTMKTDDHWLLLKMNMGAGHSGSSGRYDYLREIAFDYAFIIDSLGVNR